MSILKDKTTPLNPLILPSLDDELGDEFLEHVLLGLLPSLHRVAARAALLRHHARVKLLQVVSVATGNLRTNIDDISVFNSPEMYAYYLFTGMGVRILHNKTSTYLGEDVDDAGVSGAHGLVGHDGKLHQRDVVSLVATKLKCVSIEIV